MQTVTPAWADASDPSGGSLSVVKTQDGVLGEGTGSRGLWGLEGQLPSLGWQGAGQFEATPSRSL